MKIKNYKYFLFIILISAVAGCGDLFRSLPDLMKGSVKYPEVVYTYPAHKAEGVELTKSIVAVFSKEMDESTINKNTFIVKKVEVVTIGPETTTTETIIDGDLSFHNKDTVVFRTSGSSKLERLKKYSISITKDVKDLENNNLQDNYVWEFNTGNSEDIAPPEVIASEPAMYIYITENIIAKAVFNEDVDPFSITAGNFVLKKDGVGTAIPGTVSYTAASRSAIFVPASPLEAEASYTAVVSGVKDLSDNVMSVDSTWGFRHLKTYDTPCDIPGLNLDCCINNCQ